MDKKYDIYSRSLINIMYTLIQQNGMNEADWLSPECPNCVRWFSSAIPVSQKRPTVPFLQTQVTFPAGPSMHIAVFGDAHGLNVSMHSSRLSASMIAARKKHSHTGLNHQHQRK